MKYTSDAIINQIENSKNKEKAIDKYRKVVQSTEEEFEQWLSSNSNQFVLLKDELVSLKNHVNSSNDSFKQYSTILEQLDNQIVMVDNQEKDQGSFKYQELLKMDLQDLVTQKKSFLEQTPRPLQIQGFSANNQNVTPLKTRNTFDFKRLSEAESQSDESYQNLSQIKKQVTESALHDLELALIEKDVELQLECLVMLQKFEMECLGQDEDQGRNCQNILLDFKYVSGYLRLQKQFRHQIEEESSNVQSIDDACAYFLEFSSLFVRDPDFRMFCQKIFYRIASKIQRSNFQAQLDRALGRQVLPVLNMTQEKEDNNKNNKNNSKNNSQEQLSALKKFASQQNPNLNPQEYDIFQDDAQLYLEDVTKSKDFIETFLSFVSRVEIIITQKLPFYANSEDLSKQDGENPSKAIPRKNKGYLFFSDWCIQEANFLIENLVLNFSDQVLQEKERLERLRDNMEVAFGSFDVKKLSLVFLVEKLFTQLEIARVLEERQEDYDF